jgi:hypothetical protein
LIHIHFLLSNSADLPVVQLPPNAASEWLAEIGLKVIRTELDNGALLIDILEAEKQS